VHLQRETEWLVLRDEKSEEGGYGCSYFSDKHHRIFISERGLHFLMNNHGLRNDGTFKKSMLPWSH